MTAPTILDNAEAPDAPESVTRAVAGDTTAVADLYTQYHGLVFRYIYRRTSNPVLAEDLAADVFLRVLRRISTFTWQGTDIGAWILAIARNIVADYYKSGRYRFETLADPYDHNTGIASTDLEGRVDETVTALVDNTVITRMISKLPPDQRNVIILRFLKGLDLNETAAALGKNPSSVKALQFRATRRLAAALADRYPEGWQR